MAAFSKDYLYELFQKPSRESFREYFQNSTGEMNDIDFKAQLEADSKLAKHILEIGIMVVALLPLELNKKVMVAWNMSVLQTLWTKQISPKSSTHLFPAI